MFEPHQRPDIGHRKLSPAQRRNIRHRRCHSPGVFFADEIHVGQCYFTDLLFTLAVRLMATVCVRAQTLLNCLDVNGRHEVPYGNRSALNKWNDHKIGMIAKCGRTMHFTSLVNDFHAMDIGDIRNANFVIFRLLLFRRINSFYMFILWPRQCWAIVNLWETGRQAGGDESAAIFNKVVGRFISWVHFPNQIKCILAEILARDRPLKTESDQPLNLNGVQRRKRENGQSLSLHASVMVAHLHTYSTIENEKVT